MQRPFWQILAILILTTTWAACDAASEAEDTGSDGATPTTAVGQAAGPVSQLVAADTLAVANEISENTAIALQEIYNFEEADRGDRYFQAAINAGAINDVYEFGTDTGSLQIEDLAVALTEAGQATNNTWPGESCSSDGVCNCTYGGTRDYTGTLNIVSDTSSRSGTISGDYAITYDECVDIVTLDVSDTPCNVFVKLTGTVEQSVNIEFSDFIETNNYDEFSTSSDRAVVQSTITQVAMDFNLSDSFSGTFTTEDSIDFNFEYDFTDGTPQIKPDGSATYNGTEYNMVTLQNFVEDSTNAEVCQ